LIEIDRMIKAVMEEENEDEYSEPSPKNEIESNLVSIQITPKKLKQSVTWAESAKKVMDANPQPKVGVDPRKKSPANVAHLV